MEARKIKKGIHNCHNCETYDKVTPATWIIDTIFGEAALCNKCKKEIQQEGLF